MAPGLRRFAVPRAGYPIRQEKYRQQKSRFLPRIRETAKNDFFIVNL